VWLVTEPAAAGSPNGALAFRGDSDAHIVRGLIAILLRLFSGRPAAEILAFDTRAAFERLGLTGALSSQRSNGLASMVARIRRDAELAAAA
jgi:cysteine desulfuration protein SufE